MPEQIRKTQRFKLKKNKQKKKEIKHVLTELDLDHIQHISPS